MYLYAFKGKHVFSDISNIDSKLLENVSFLKEILKEAILKSKSTITNYGETIFENNACCLFFLLEESHADIHTYPEHNSLFFDAFTCGDIDPEIILKEFIKNLNKDIVMNTDIKLRGNH